MINWIRSDYYFSYADILRYWHYMGQSKTWNSWLHLSQSAKPNSGLIWFFRSRPWDSPPCTGTQFSFLLANPSGPLKAHQFSCLLGVWWLHESNWGFLGFLRWLEASWGICVWLCILRTCKWFGIWFRRVLGCFRVRRKRCKQFFIVSRDSVWICLFYTSVSACRWCVFSRESSAVSGIRTLSGLNGITSSRILRNLSKNCATCPVENRNAHNPTHLS